jgi:AcrR family transcriptional regulator
MFWEHGYEGVDVERIARAVNVTKPALYRAFGDKPTLLLKAVERYAMMYMASHHGSTSSGAGHPQGRDRL